MGANTQLLRQPVADGDHPVAALTVLILDAMGGDPITSREGSMLKLLSSCVLGAPLDGNQKRKLQSLPEIEAVNSRKLANAACRKRKFDRIVIYSDLPEGPLYR